MNRRIRRPAARAAAVTGFALAASAVTVTAAVAAGPPLPDLRGGSLMNAYRTVDFGTPIRSYDVSGLRRHVLWPPSWKVCTQAPPPGAAAPQDGTVTLGVVKKPEPCPA